MRFMVVEVIKQIIIAGQVVLIGGNGSVIGFLLRCGCRLLTEFRKEVEILLIDSYFWFRLLLVCFTIVAPESIWLSWLRIRSGCGLLRSRN